MPRTSRKSDAKSSMLSKKPETEKPVKHALSLKKASLTHGCESLEKKRSVIRASSQPCMKLFSPIKNINNSNSPKPSNNKNVLTLTPVTSNDSQVIGKSLPSSTQADAVQISGGSSFIKEEKMVNKGKQERLSPERKSVSKAQSSHQMKKTQIKNSGKENIKKLSLNGMKLSSTPKRATSNDNYREPELNSSGSSTENGFTSESEETSCTCSDESEEPSWTCSSSEVSLSCSCSGECPNVSCSCTECEDHSSISCNCEDREADSFESHSSESSPHDDHRNVFYHVGLRTHKAKRCHRH